MPDSAPEEYKKLAKQCCDADPDKRPDAYTLYCDILGFYNRISFITMIYGMPFITIM